MADGAIALKPVDRKRLASILAERAIGAPPEVGIRGYFRGLIDRTPLPDTWRQERLGGWTGAANYDAQNLISWATPRGVNPADPKWTTLGRILLTMLEEDVGLDVSAMLVALIDVYGLCVNATELAALRQRYGVPARPVHLAAAPKDTGPDFDWRGPEDPVELQSFLRPEPPLLDVGFLMEAIRNAAAVCRVELAKLGRSGTGVLIASDLVLTNHHVMRWSDAEDMDANAREVVLRFHCMSAEGGQESEGQAFALAAQGPIVRSSPALDYALLRVHEEIHGAPGLRPAAIGDHEPAVGAGINILQHPEGGPMKLAMSSNGVTGIYDDGRLQYVTNAAGGSSGSPCFDDDWKVVALHHAARARAFGRIGEGIRLSHILEEIGRALA